MLVYKSILPESNQKMLNFLKKQKPKFQSLIEFGHNSIDTTTGLPKFYSLTLSCVNGCPIRKIRAEGAYTKFLDELFSMAIGERRAARIQHFVPISEGLWSNKVEHFQYRWCYLTKNESGEVEILHNDGFHTNTEWSKLNKDGTVKDNRHNLMFLPRVIPQMHIQDNTAFPVVCPEYNGLPFLFVYSCDKSIHTIRKQLEAIDAKWYHFEKSSVEGYWVHVYSAQYHATPNEIKLKCSDLQLIDIVDYND